MEKEKEKFLGSSSKSGSGPEPETVSEPDRDRKFRCKYLSEDEKEEVVVGFLRDLERSMLRIFLSLMIADYDESILLDKYGCDYNTLVAKFEEQRTVLEAVRDFRSGL